MAAAVAGAKDHSGGTIAQVASHLLLARRHTEAHGGDAEPAVSPATRPEVVECEPVGVGGFDTGRLHALAADRVAEHSQSVLVDLKRPCCAGVALFPGMQHEADRAPADLHSSPPLRAIKCTIQRPSAWGRSSTSSRSSPTQLSCS